MKFYTKIHNYYCGIDLHARSLYVCILNKDGKVVEHKEISANPNPNILRANAVQLGLTNEWLKVQGLVSLKEQWVKFRYPNV